MSNNPTTTTLDVRDFASNGGDGYTNAQATNGATYSYRYTGGNQPGNDGSIQYGIGHGNAAITLNLSSDPRYQIASVGFQNDPNSQLSTHGNANTTRVINNSCSGPLDGKYTVTVLDTSANTTIPCDPAIKNVPA